MELTTPQLNFPQSFCCNCGVSNCMNEIQDTRVTRYFGFGGVETTFKLAIPVCADCRKSTRRRPPSWFGRLLVYGLTTAVMFCLLLYVVSGSSWPSWITDNLFYISAGLSLVLVISFYRLRRPTPPQTSYYQPVRIRDVNVQFGDGFGVVAFLKLAFTNQDYLNVFTLANRDAINARRIAVVKARTWSRKVKSQTI